MWLGSKRSKWSCKKGTKKGWPCGLTSVITVLFPVTFIQRLESASAVWRRRWAMMPKAGRPIWAPAWHFARQRVPERFSSQLRKGRCDQPGLFSVRQELNSEPGTLLIQPLGRGHNGRVEKAGGVLSLWTDQHLQSLTAGLSDCWN